MDVLETKELTMEEIDGRLAENSARLVAIGDELKAKNDALGSARGFRLPTVGMIHKAIDNLEHEKRELEAEQSFLSQERKRVQDGITRQAAEAAAAEYESLRAKITPQAVEIINTIFALQNQLDKYEEIESRMKAKGGIAGKPVAGGVIRIRTGEISSHIYQALYNFRQYNNSETLQEAGIDILGFFQERDRTRSGVYFVGSESTGINASESGEPAPRVEGFDAAMRKAAGLPVE